MFKGCGEKLELVEKQVYEMIEYDLDHDVQPRETVEFAKKYLETYDKVAHYKKLKNGDEIIKIDDKEIGDLEVLYKKLVEKLEKFPDPWKADIPVMFDRYRTVWEQCVYEAPEGVNEELLNVLEEYGIEVTDDIELKLLSLL